VVRARILPRDSDTKLTEILESVKSRLPKEMEIVNTWEEPIAFGIAAAVIDVRMEDKEGILDVFESAVNSADAVSRLEVVAMSRSAVELR